METKSLEDKVEKQLGDSCCINSLGAMSEDYPLCKAMVNHDHNRIKASGEGKIGDEIDRELFEGIGLLKFSSEPKV